MLMLHWSDVQPTEAKGYHHGMCIFRGRLQEAVTERRYLTSKGMKQAGTTTFVSVTLFIFKQTHEEEFVLSRSDSLAISQLALNVASLKSFIWAVRLLRFELSVMVKVQAHPTSFTHIPCLCHSGSTCLVSFKLKYLFNSNFTFLVSIVKATKTLFKKKNVMPLHAHANRSLCTQTTENVSLWRFSIGPQAENSAILLNCKVNVVMGWCQE